ncbi:MF14A protein, partial [Upupa epops]|nr:MF14A protein [Upupa epops]
RQGIGEPSVYHAVVVIFLEFFAWGLLTTPMLTVLHQTFPQHTFLMNGLIHGVKGLLSFLSAPLIGALSDVWGRKSFLLLTVFFTCAPIPLMKISPWWYFAVISVSGVFAVTFSVVFAYVADITQEHERSTAYGLVSATFAASLVTSPAIGAYLAQAHGDTLVVLLASGVALLDIGFILLAVPESLPEEMRPVSWGAPISWEQADPFAVTSRGARWPLHARGARALCPRLRERPFGRLDRCLPALPPPPGVVQGMITGIRGLCNGLGPALYGFVFYLFHVELNEMAEVETLGRASRPNMANPTDESSIIPGPPFLFGACSVLLSLLVALFIPEHNLVLRAGSHKKHGNGAQAHPHGPQAAGSDGKEPLLEDSSV